MIGSIVGVGVFGLPYAFAQSGLLIGVVELLIIGLLLVYMQLMYSEIVLRTEEPHRFAGYIGTYLGERWGKIAASILSCASWGAMTAFMIVGGNFLFLLLSPILGGPEVLYVLAMTLAAGALIYRGYGFASVVETGIVVAVLFLFTFIILLSLPEIQLAHFSGVNVREALVPYGVLLFSMTGLGFVPEMRDLLGRKLQHRLGHAILIGMSLIGLLYLLFSVVIVGVTGPDTTQVAFDALLPVLGPVAGVIAASLGALTIFSIFSSVGIQLKNAFTIDLRLDERVSFVLVMAVPVVLYGLGVRELTNLISFVGSVFTGTLGALLVLAYIQMRRSPACRKHVCIEFPLPLAWSIIALFVGGSVLTLVQTLF